MSAVKAFIRAAAVAAFCAVLSHAPQSWAADDKPWPQLDVALGKADAPITIIEYASLTCPHCADFAEQTLPKFKSEWIDTGKARLIYRDFPLDGRSLAAAMVSHCSNDRYFAFLDTFYASQKVWGTAPDAITALKNVGKLGGLSDKQVDDCLQNRDLMKQIQDRKQEGVDRYGLDSTPSFVINGKVYAGFFAYDDFVKLLKK